MEEDIVKELLRIIAMQEQHMMEIESRFTKMLEQSEARLKDVHDIIKGISSDKHNQTETFVLQINKLSSRLDEHVKALSNAQQALLEEGHRSDHLLNILHDATRKGDTHTNTYNNM